jgi:phage terminase large subunit
VSESFPHLKRGAMKDFLNIMKEHNYFKSDLWNKTDSVYTFETGSTIEFFSVDQAEKVRGARRDRLFINEANNISFSAFEELEVRTKEFIFMDWNPTNEFWFYTDVLNNRDDVEHIILTYKDNEALSPVIVKSFETKDILSSEIFDESKL